MFNCFQGLWWIGIMTVKQFFKYENWLFLTVPSSFGEEVASVTFSKEAHMIRINRSIEVTEIPLCTREQLLLMLWVTQAMQRGAFDIFQLHICKNIMEASWQGDHNISILCSQRGFLPMFSDIGNTTQNRDSNGGRRSCRGHHSPTGLCSAAPLEYTKPWDESRAPEGGRTWNSVLYYKVYYTIKQWSSNFLLWATFSEEKIAYATLNSERRGNHS